MQCQCEHGEKHNFKPCPNEATETVLTPYGEFSLCSECAEEMRRALRFLVHEVPKKTLLIVTDRPSVQLQALANALGALLRTEGRTDVVRLSMPDNIQN